MSTSQPTPLARLIAERRQAERREPTDEPVLSLFEVFQRDERSIWRRLDRRIAIRRERDVQRRIAKL